MPQEGQGSLHPLQWFAPIRRGGIDDHANFSKSQRGPGSVRGTATVPRLLDVGRVPSWKILERPVNGWYSLSANPSQLRWSPFELVTRTARLRNLCIWICADQRDHHHFRRRQGINRRRWGLFFCRGLRLHGKPQNGFDHDTLRRLGKSGQDVKVQHAHLIQRRIGQIGERELHRQFFSYSTERRHGLPDQLCPQCISKAIPLAVQEWQR